MLTRRRFLGAVAASVALPSVAARGQQQNEWGVPVFDLHFHLRARPADNLAHLDGAGISKANLLTRASALGQVGALQSAAPGRFTWFSSADVSQPEAVTALRQAIGAGAQGFGEMKYHAATDGEEFRRAYELATELKVPILIHFQEVDHSRRKGRGAPDSPPGSKPS